MKTNRRILQKDKTMLRVFLIFFFSLSYFSYPQEEGTPANLQQYDLKGTVKSVETIAKPIGEKDSVKYHGLSTYKSSQVFNIYGLLVEENENFDETENDSKILCYYNAKHKLTQKITFKHSDKLAEMRRYSYDTLGQIIKYEFYGKDTTYLISSKYFYYLDTKLIKSIDSSFGTGVLTDFIYDEYGNLAEKRRYDEDGKLDFSNSYNYDERGNLVKHNLLTVDYQKDQI
jgi:hypothetical protein